MLICEKCLRFFSAERELLCPQPRWFGVPEMFVCAEADCPTIESAIAEENRRRSTPPRRKGTNGTNGTKVRHSQSSTFNSQPLPTARGCPPERDFSDEQAKQFAAATEREKDSALGLDTEVLRLHDFLGVKHFGEYFENGFLEKELNIGRLNSVAAKLRERYEEDRMALDVDTRAKSARVWLYRVCHKRDSFRLQQENPSRAAK